MKIRESIRHGRNSQTRETFVNDTHLGDAVVALLLTSPYVYRRPHPATVDVYAELLGEQGYFNHGWSDFEDIEADDRQRANRAAAKQAREDEMQALVDALSKKDES